MCVLWVVKYEKSGIRELVAEQQVCVWVCVAMYECVYVCLRTCVWGHVCVSLAVLFCLTIFLVCVYIPERVRVWEWVYMCMYKNWSVCMCMHVGLCSSCMCFNVGVTYEKVCLRVYVCIHRVYVCLCVLERGCMARSFLFNHMVAGLSPLHARRSNVC